uniref:SOSEKI DIX-like domain-containing protein n=1 Tax=Oryza punctata TaxID=4537 RepID=A0A0E0JUB1_ORYPU
MANHSDGDGWASPERTVVKKKQPVVVGVVYYLCRQDGQLDQPHFVHVPCLSHSDLHLRDFIARLTDLRGAAMPAAYSWSAKRTYRRNAGYVWQDLAADDLILPASNHHDDYVLKGSPLLLPLHDSTKHNKHKRWTSLDLADYQLQRTTNPIIPPAEQSLIGIDEISPPPSSSSPPDDTTLKHQQQAAAGRLINGRMRASAMLMQIISCGASSIKELHNKKQAADEQRDYFSGSLVEKNSSNTISAGIDLTLRRSSSCNAHRGASSRLGVVDQDGVPRRNMACAHAEETHHTSDQIIEEGISKLSYT